MARVIRHTTGKTGDPVAHNAVHARVQGAAKRPWIERATLLAFTVVAGMAPLMELLKDGVERHTAIALVVASATGAFVACAPITPFGRRMKVVWVTSGIVFATIAALG